MLFGTRVLRMAFEGGRNSVKNGVQYVVEGGMSALVENKISQKVFVMY